MSQDDVPAIVVTAGEDNVLVKGRLLYPERGPSRFASRMAKAAVVAGRAAGPARLFLVPSPCLWYGVAELLEDLPSDGAVLCIETDPALANLAEKRMPAAIAADPRLRFVPGEDRGAWIAAAAALGRFRRVMPTRLSGGSDLEPAALREAIALLDEEFASYWKNRASLAAMGRLWMRNIFRNLARMEDIAPLPLPRVAGPTVVCGAGPSLEVALPFIRKNRKSLNVVAADTAVKSLVAADIVPDLVVCLEAQIWNLRDFIGVTGLGFAVLADLSYHPDSFGVSPSANLLSGVRIVDGPFLDRLHNSGLPLLLAPPLGSVGVHALHVARRLGAAPCFVSGLDFAFPPGKTHVRGSPAVAADAHSSSRLAPIGSRPLEIAYREGVRTVREGGDQLTDPVLSRYAALMSEEIALHGPPVYDIRAGRGIPLGAPILDFDDFVGSLGGPAPTGITRAARAGMGFEGDASAISRNFMETELKRLVSLEELLRGGRRTAAADLAKAIGDLDYLLWPMPDAERLASLPQDLLNRVLVETEYWIAQLRNLAYYRVQ